MWASQPNWHGPSQVKVAGIELQIDPLTWDVDEAPRFGEKLSIGAPKYADFQFFESSEAAAYLTGGYGLRRYSDIGDDALAHTMYSEALGVDCRFGPVICAPLVTVDTLVGSTGAAIFLGQFQVAGLASALVAVIGTKVWQLDPSGPPDFWVNVLTLPATPIAVNSFNHKLIFGYGSAHTAQYTDNLTVLKDLTDTTPTVLYVWAATSDRAASYVAGGPATTDSYRVTSSTVGGTAYSTTLTNCGDPGQPIVSLAPGGGIDLLLIGKNNELGALDLTAAYHVLVPYDSTWGANSQGLRWWMGTADAQRGPLIAVFTRDRSAWSYQPSTQTSGTATDLAPWADYNIRPLNVRGVPAAYQGTARWLYYTLTTSAGHSYLVVRDGRSGVTHSLLDLGVRTANAMVVAAVAYAGQNPRLYYGYGSNLAYHTLPFDGEYPVDDAACRYQSGGTLTFPEMDLGFPDEPKIPFSVRVNVDNVVPLHRYITLSYSADGGVWTTLGTVDVAPFVEIPFPSNVAEHRLQLRAQFFTDDSTQTPVLLGFSVRVSLNPKLYRIWKFQAITPAGSTIVPSDDLQNPHTVQATLWNVRTAGVPISFVDRWGDAYMARLFHMHVLTQGAPLDSDRTPESRIELTMLEFGPGAGAASTTEFDAPGPGVAFFPLTVS